MKRFKRIFAFLFILSLFVGVVHQHTHAHHKGELCEICVFAHAPALLADIPTVTHITPIAQQFDPLFSSHDVSPKISLRSRSPPLA